MRKFLFLLFALLFAFNLSAQRNFVSKEKKDTVLDMSHLNFRAINSVPSLGLSKKPGKKYRGKSFVKPALKGKGQQKISDADVSLRIIQSAQGNPNLIEWKRNASNQRKAPLGTNRDSSAADFLLQLKPYLKFSDKAGFQALENRNTNIKMKQTYKGLDFYGKEIIVHFNQYGEGVLFNGVYSRCDFELDTASRLNKDQILQIVFSDLQKKAHVAELSEGEKAFYQYEGPLVRKVVFESDDFVLTHHIAYEVELKANVLETWKYLVDANEGKILRSYSILCSVDGPATASATDLNGISRTINTYLEGAQYKFTDASKFMYNAGTNQGVIKTLDAQNTPASQFVEITSATNTWNHPAGVSAHYNAGIAYDYFYLRHGRNSINGQGGNILSFVNVSDDFGQGLDNAYWNGQAIFYGNGDEAFFPLAKSLDVAGHEMTHGVVQNTANLDYYDESGAINESMADIFGCMMDSTDWLIGEDVVQPAYFPSGALRSLQDPHQGGSSLSDNGYQPKHVSEQYLGSADNRGVHINSGIPNHAFYLLATSIGRSKAANIFYKALSAYLTRYSYFVDLRVACVQSAKDLYGDGSSEVLNTEQAFDAVGIVGGGTTVVSTTLPVNPGQDYLLTVDTYPDPASVYRSSVSGTNFYVLSQKVINSPPSITDDGTKAVYVAGDDNIYSLDLSDPSNPIETLLQNQGIWSNVAISKDGSRLAAVTVDEDTAIFVYDFVSDTWAKFHLYNPTYSSGVKAGGPVYADALEWDYNGEYLIYDAFNRITNVSGQDIEYWDVNFLRVWDKEINDFGDGDIQKLFSNLPEGVSIGNPVFSKNSPYVIAFDYTDEVYGDYAVMGFDIENNKQGVIFVGNYLGWPSYSKLDNKLVSTYYNYSVTDGWREAIAVINLNADKVSSSGNWTPLVDYAKWPRYYTMGTRDIIISGTSEESEKEYVKIYPNPFDDSFSLISKEYKMEEVYVYDSKGSLVKNQQVNSYEGSVYAPDLPPGIYLIKVLVDNTYQTFKMLKK